MQENSKIKVLFVIDTLEGYGAEKSLVEIAKNLKEVSPVFVHIYKGAMLKTALEEADIKVYSMNLKQKYGFSKAVKLLQKIYLEEKPHLIHATLYRSEIITRKLKSKFPEIKLIGSLVSNAYSKDRYFGKDYIARLKLHYFYMLEKKTVPMVDLFISNSHTIKEVTSRALKIPDEKIQVVFRGRDKNNYKNFIYKRDDNIFKDKNIVLLNVSRLIPLKGQLDLIRSLPEVIEKFDIKLIIAGDGYYKARLEIEIVRLHLEDYVELIGRTNNVINCLEKSDLFLYPSYSEGLPGALIEAMMAGNIIIASDIPENLECVNESCAVIFEKGNVVDLSNKILKVLGNLNEYKKLGMEAQKTAFEKFDIKKIAGQYESVYWSLYEKKAQV